MKFDAMSRNNIIILEELLKDQELLKYVEYNESSPQLKDDIDNVGSLVFRKIFPTPFDEEVPTQEETNLRAFFPDGELQNDEVLHSTISFQVVTHNNLWNVYRKDGKKGLRPYEIMSKVVDIFEGKTIKTVGVIHFNRYMYQNLGNDYGMYVLEGTLTTI